MKLLFDENVSHKLASRLADEYPGSAHVRNVGLLGNAGTDAIAQLLQAQRDRLARFEPLEETSLLILSISADAV